jgi:hypothetical protein
MALMTTERPALANSPSRPTATCCYSSQDRPDVSDQRPSRSASGTACVVVDFAARTCHSWWTANRSNVRSILLRPPTSSCGLADYLRRPDTATNKKADYAAHYDKFSINVTGQ